jgi:Superoxide dismutase
MMNISRREAITGLVGAGAAIVSLSDSAFGAESQTNVAAFRGQHQPKPLTFDATKLNGISEKLIKSHHENNYTGAVKALNVVEQHLAEMLKMKDVPAYLYGDLKREELMRTGSVILHEKYFANLGGNGKADGKALKTIEQNFGAYENWETEFKRTGNALSGGSGWTILAYNNHTKEFHNYWAGDHTQIAAFSTPLLVLDMYEHAYQMDYGAAAAKYVDAFMQNVNWDEVNRRLEETR